MSQDKRLNRRAFLKGAGMTALASTVGTSSCTMESEVRAAQDPSIGRFDFDKIYSRIGTNSTKWDRQIERFGAENIDVGMGIADMDFRAAPCITRALADRCQHENWGYGGNSGSYIEAIVDWNKRRYDLDIDPRSVALSNGVHPGIVAALKTFSPPGSKVLMSTPTYNGFYGDLRRCNLQPEDSPMILVDGAYSIDFDDLEARISDETKTLILCNPQNPTGNCWSAQDLMRLGELCLRRGVVVLADEIHCDFIMKGQTYTPFASLPNKDVVDNSLTFKAASKSFSISTMHSAWFFSTNREYLARVKANNQSTLTPLSMAANRAALTEGDEWLDQLVPYIDGNHDLVEAYVRDEIPHIRYKKAQGTFLAWLDISEALDKTGAKEAAADRGRGTAEGIFERWLVENAKVQLNPGASYGTGGTGHMRMNLGTSRKLVQLALDNMARALRSA